MAEIKIGAATTKQDVNETKNDQLHQYLINATPEAIRAIPIEARMQMVDNLLKMWVSYDDQAAIAKLIVADPGPMAIALAEKGLLDDAIRFTTNTGRFGFFRAGRDFPTQDLSDASHEDKIRHAIISTKSEDVARAFESLIEHKAGSLNDTGMEQEMRALATGIRGAATQNLNLQPPVGPGVSVGPKKP